MGTVESLVSVTEAAQRASVSRKAVWKWIYSGKLLARQVGGGQWAIREDDLSVFLSSYRIRKTRVGVSRS